MVMTWPCAAVLSLVPAAAEGMVNVRPEEVTWAPGPALALVNAVWEKLEPPPSRLPRAVLLSALIPTLLNDAARFGYGCGGDEEDEDEPVVGTKGPARAFRTALYAGLGW